MPFTTYLDTQIMKLLFGDTSYTIPANFYVALFSAAPSQSGGGTELTGGNYSRVSVANNTTNWVPATSQPSTGYEMTNGVAITFPTANANWTGAVAAGLYDASTGGNLLAYATFSSVAVQSGATASFAAGALTFTNN